MTNSNQIASGLKIVSRQPVEKARKFRYTHRVPNTLEPHEPQQIISELLGGRSVFDTAANYNTTTAVVMELWARRIERKVKRLEICAGVAA